MSSDHPFYTIGHSNRSLEDFIGMLTGFEIDLVVDIRTIPKSRANPQFNKDTFADDLLKVDISYEHLEALGGLRSKSHDVSSEVNGFWNNDSFHNYADYALTEAFDSGFERLLELGKKHRLALMCAEAVWWRCHRRIVTDYLIAHDKKVCHIMGEDRSDEASLTKGAEVRKDKKVIYPPKAT